MHLSYVCYHTAITCRDHSAPKHGTIKYDGYTPRSRVHYSCNPGYKLEGLAYRTCDYLGKWSGELPKCIRECYDIIICANTMCYILVIYSISASICPKLDVPKHGNIHVASYSSGSIAFYYCEKGYKREGGGFRKCQDDCTWSGKQPRCIRKHRLLIYM